MTVLLTRPEAENREIADALAAEEIPSLAWPLTRIAFGGEPLAIPAGTDGLIATSANGLRAFAAKSPRRDLPVLAVGCRTAALAAGLGFADVRSADGDAAALAGLAAASGLRRLFHPRGADATGDLAARLAAAGVAVSQQVVYRAVPMPPEPPAPVAALLASGAPAVLTVWSPRNAALFAAAAALGPALRRIHAVAISERAAEPLRPLGLAGVRVAERPDREAMLAAIRRAHAALRC